MHLLIASSLKIIVFGSITYSCHLNIIFHYQPVSLVRNVSFLSMPIGLPFQFEVNCQIYQIRLIIFAINLIYFSYTKIKPAKGKNRIRHLIFFCPTTFLLFLLEPLETKEEELIIVFLGIDPQTKPYIYCLVLSCQNVNSTYLYYFGLTYLMYESLFIPFLSNRTFSVALELPSCFKTSTLLF